MVEDAVQRDGDAPRERQQRIRLMLPRVPARGSCSASYRVLLTRRGRYRFGPLHVSTRFPFGLVRSSRSWTIVRRCWSVRGWGT